MNNLLEEKEVCSRYSLQTLDVAYNDIITKITLNSQSSCFQGLLFRSRGHMPSQDLPEKGLPFVIKRNPWTRDSETPVRLHPVVAFMP